MSSSPAPQASTQPLSYRDDPLDENRNDQVSDNEEAALLGTQEDDQDQPAPTKRSPNNIKTIRTLTALTLISSTLAAMLLIALRIFISHDSWADYELLWPTRAGSRAVGITAIFSILTSLSNLTQLSKPKPKQAPILINLISDFLIGLMVLAYAIPALANITGTQCIGYPPLDYDRCHKHALPSRAMVGVALGLGLVYGVVHLTLFAMRLYTALHEKADTGITVPAWRIPSGKLKFETAVTFERQEERAGNEGRA